MIARTIKGSDLLQYERGALRELDGPFLRDVVRFLDHAAWIIENLSVAERLRAGGLRDVDVRLTGAHKQRYAILAQEFAAERHQMLVVEFAVELRARVHHLAIDCAADRDIPHPVLRS